MMNRHRVPTVFSIYMLDVICCALGCVILLWQVKHNEAEEQTEAARLAEAAAMQAQASYEKADNQVHSATAEIDALRSQLAESQKQYKLQNLEISRLTEQLGASGKKQAVLSIDLVRTQKDLDEANRLVALRKKEYESLKQAHLLSEALLKTVRGEKAKLEDLQKLTALDLADKVKANAELLLQITAAQKKSQTLEKQVAAQKLDAEEAAKRLADQLARLEAVEEMHKNIAKQAANLRSADKDRQAKLTASELRIKILEQELEKSKDALRANGKDADEAAAIIAGLQKEKYVLVERAKALQAEAEQRFAGIALTGRNVLFLVDMSGSMAMADEKTPDPDKWPLVCETVVQLMRSLKGLQYFQVLAFSDKVRYPMGSPAAWLKYDPKETPAKVRTALKAVNPDGETNMHAVFAEAFRYREAKLDTIYILSDGLPNAGGDLPASLSEAERTTALSKHLRARLKNDWNRKIAGQPQVRINSIGFFFESPDVGAFLWALSREHGGSFVGMSK
jgi:hypothetical protein